MIGTVEPLVDLKGLLIELFGLGMARLVFEHGGEITHCGRDIRMRVAVSCSRDGKRPPHRRLGIGQSTGVQIEVAEIVEHLVVVRRGLGILAKTAIEQLDPLLQQSLAVVEAPEQSVDISKIVHRGSDIQGRRVGGLQGRERPFEIAAASLKFSLSRASPPSADSVPASLPSLAPKALVPSASARSATAVASARRSSMPSDPTRMFEVRSVEATSLLRSLMASAALSLSTASGKRPRSWRNMPSLCSTPA